MDKALLLDNLSLRIDGRQIFSDLYMEAAHGEVLSICGTSSSHMHMLPALLTRTLPDSYTLSGTLMVDGAEIESLSAEEMRFFRMMNIAVLPGSDSACTLGIPVKRYITMPFKETVKKPIREIMADTRRIMELLGITNPERVMHRRISSLDIKDRRAVLYAAALSTDPAVAIAFADAPDMSPTDADAFYSLLVKVCKIKNITLLLLTSDIELARKFGERVFIAKHDRILPLEGATHPYLHFLEAASTMRTMDLAPHGETELLSAVHTVPARGAQSLDFTLHSGEILAFSCKNGLSVFTGRKRPVSGHLLLQGLPFRKNKAFSKKIMPIHLGMPLPPANTVDDLLLSYAVRPSQKLQTASLYASLGLPTDFGKLSAMQPSALDTLRIGLACAAISEARVILLSDVETLPSRADRYEIMTLLAKVCAHSGAGALVFSNNTELLHVIGTRFYQETAPMAAPTPVESEV